MKKIGPLLAGRAVLPVIGADAFHKSNIQTETNSYPSLSLGLELFQSEEESIIVLQQRGPISRGMESQYIQMIVKLIIDFGFKSTLMVTGCHASTRPDPITEVKELLIESEEANPSRIVPTKSFVESVVGAASGSNTARDQNHIAQWVKSNPNLASHISQMKTTWVKKKPIKRDAFVDSPRISGGGISARLFTEMEGNDIRFAVVALYCSEGDNVGDGLRLAQDALALARATVVTRHGKKENQQELKTVRWVAPESWRNLFGSAVNPVLYG